MPQILQKYLSTVHGVYASGQATEHSYRKSLEILFSEVTGFKVTNEPKRSEHGAPDFIFQDGMFPVCYAEAKDITVPLEKIENSEQLSRYFGYAKLILTNGLEFRFYHNGTRYGEPIVLAELKSGQFITHEDKFEYFLKSFAAFLDDYVDTIRNAGDLAKIMGGKARRIRDNVIDMLGNEKSEKFAEIKQMQKIFKELLIHDLDDKKFADLYAQTLVYGLFVARYNDKTPEDFSRAEARELVPKSNPLLRKFFDHIAGEAFEKRLAYIVDELCKVFMYADVHALMHGLYQKKDIETHDPVIHFYEDFLKEYDSKLRMERGVFYTPMPVVKFMVRAIDDILKTHFGLGRGLLDTSKIDVEYDSQMETKGGKTKKSTKKVHRVQLLDPATGTGTFLNEVIKFVHSKMQNQQGLWNEYVNTDLLPRLHGFELMMASYTIAHLKLGLTLSETGVDELTQRLKVYLTNSLEEGVKVQNDLFSFGLLGSLTEEAIQAGHIKSEEPIMIVLGNPPYSGISTNTGKWITKKIEDYKYVNGEHFGERKHWLQDDYVKFFRLSESLIERRGEGILAFITNHGYIDNPTFRGMRYHLLQTFDDIYIVDLHGNSKKKETADDGSVDQNVFDIQQGVSIFFGVKTGKKKSSELAKVHHSDVFGKRELKYDWLTQNDIATISWNYVEMDKKFYFFCPKDFGLHEQYNAGFGIQEFFIENGLGAMTGRDNFTLFNQVVDIDIFLRDIEELGLDEIRTKYNAGKDTSNWDLQKAILDIKENKNSNLTKEFTYRLFDTRKTLYTGNSSGFHSRPQSRIGKNFIDDNLALISGRAGQNVGGIQWNLIYITNNLADLNLFYRGGATMFPLYLYSESGTFETGAGEVQVLKTPNFNMEIISKIEKNLGLKLVGNEYFHSDISRNDNNRSLQENEFIPEDILDYIYAVLHSKTYRETYKEFLKIDFPKIPYPKDKSNFFELVKLGRELRSFHLLENPKIWEFITSYSINGENLVEKVKFELNETSFLSDERREFKRGIEGKVYINGTQYFSGISKEVFEFQIGGYKPAEKYLKDRKGRNLSSQEFENYQKMIVALSETMRIMEEIENVFEV